jgi:hypothetical protein
VVQIPYKEEIDELHEIWNAAKARNHFIADTADEGCLSSQRPDLDTTIYRAFVISAETAKS